MPLISSFTILYDAECGLCTSTEDWIGRQARLVGLKFVAAGSPEALGLNVRLSTFPQFPHKWATSAFHVLSSFPQLRTILRN